MRSWLVPVLAASGVLAAGAGIAWADRVDDWRQRDDELRRAASQYELDLAEEIGDAADLVRFARSASPQAVEQMNLTTEPLSWLVSVDESGEAEKVVARIGQEPPTPGQQLRVGMFGEAMNRARDSGELIVSHGEPGALLFIAARYAEGVGGFTPAARRVAATGWVIGHLDVADAVPAPILDRGAVRVVDGVDIVLGERGGGAVVDRAPLRTGDRTLIVETVAPAPAIPDSARLTLVAAAIIAAMAAAVSLLLLRSRTRLEATAGARERQLSVVARFGRLMQETLDLAELLPLVAVTLADELSFDTVAIAVPDAEGRLVERFRTGGASFEMPRLANQVIADPRPAGPGEPILVPLRQGGRVVGVLGVRRRQRLDGAMFSALLSIAELLGAALGNASIFEREVAAGRSLRELDRLKTEFLGAISHELRTPAAAIAGFGELLTESWDDLDPATARDMVERIGRNGRSLSLMVEDLLDFARIERRSFRVEPTDVDLSAEAGRLADQFSTLLTDHTFERDIEPGVRAIIDVRGLERIVANLLSNAAKFSPNGSTVKLTVGVGDRPFLRVDDSGPGILPAERHKVFTRFYRGESEAALTTRGAGVGLAVVKELIDQMGAEVEISASEAGGARFEVRFAAATATRAEVAEAPA